MRIMKRLSNSDVKEINQQLNESYNLTDFITKKDVIELEDTTLFINQKAAFFYLDKKIIPTIKIIMQHESLFPLKKVTVDMGAVKFMVSGAAVMRPGIKEIDPEIKAGEIIAVIDEKNKKILCLGQALYSAAEIKAMTSGKMIRNIHYVGDSLWKISV